MSSLQSGASFGPYTIEGFIAGGGMGEVYGAVHSVYQQPVAIKVLHAHLHSDDSWRARFNEEGLVGTQLKHPNVLSARELVEHDARIALVMDLIAGGQTMLTVIEREFPSGLPLAKALQVFLPIVSGLEYLHGRDVIHGDLKPEIVLVDGPVRDPSKWVPLVTDFGTVALIGDPVLIDGRPAVVATPRYASPEHLLGVDQLVVASDVYCLGLLLHYLLCGRHSSPATTVSEAAVVVREPVSLLNLIDQPESVLELIRRSTAVDPDERYRDCAEFALALRDVLDGLGVRLALDDIKADLATEIIEEQAERQRAQFHGTPPVQDSGGDDSDILNSGDGQADTQPNLPPVPSGEVQSESEPAAEASALDNEPSESGGALKETVREALEERAGKEDGGPRLVWFAILAMLVAFGLCVALVFWVAS